MENIRDFRKFRDIDGKEYSFNYDLTFKEGKLIDVFNTAHFKPNYGIWGNSIEKNSDTFEYFKKKYEKNNIMVNKKIC